MREVRLARRHAAWRWAGAPLVLTGLFLVLLALVGRAPVLVVLLSVAGALLALASFGANHDTALAYALRVHEVDPGRLPAGLLRELAEELERDRAGTVDLRPAPRVALLMPVVALLVQGWVAWRLLG